MAAQSYIERFSDDFSLSEREVQARINLTLYPDPIPSHYVPEPSYGSLYRPRPVVEHEIDEKKMEELKKTWDELPRVEQPPDLSIKLFPHQLVSIYHMEQLERIRKVKSRTTDQIFLTDFGILGDIPGYGKSFSIVSLILRDNMPWDSTKRHETTDIYTYNNSLKVVNKLTKQRVRSNLILASPTLIEQWKEYFAFVKNDKIKLKEISSRKDLDKFDPNEWDVVLVNSTRYNDVINLVGSNVVWKRFIFDEAGSTHINSMKHVSAGFVWFISATYQQLLNCSGSYLHYMKSFFSHISMDTLQHFVIKNPILFVKHSFKMPSVFEHEHICLNPRILNVLSSYIDSEAQLMIGAGDIKGAISRLGGGSTSDSNLFEIVSKRQKEKLAQARFSLDFWRARSNSEKDIETWEKKVKELEKMIVELEEKYKTVLEDDCSICYTPIEGPVLIPCCQNVFCGKCIIKWLETSRNKCPMCRSPVNVKELVYVSKGENEDDEKRDDSKVAVKKPMSKHETVRDLITRGVNKKFLIFSMYDESFSIIRRELDEHKIDFV